jgi:hypothetical protein
MPGLPAKLTDVVGLARALEHRSEPVRQGGVRTREEMPVGVDGRLYVFVAEANLT